MRTIILSRAEAEKLIADGNFPGNAAVISFHDPDETDFVDYSAVTDTVFRIGLEDLSFDDLKDMNINTDDYFPQADKLAEFIINADNNGYNFVCQCEHGESRSAAAAAAILQFFENVGVEIFANYRYCPNQVIFNKLLDALCEHFDESLRKVNDSLVLLGIGLSPSDQNFLIRYNDDWELVFTNQYNDINKIDSDIVLINPDFLDDNTRNDLRERFSDRPGYWDGKFLLTKYDVVADEFSEIRIFSDLSDIFITRKNLPW